MAMVSCGRNLQEWIERIDCDRPDRAAKRTPRRPNNTRRNAMGIVNDHDPVETREWIDALRAVVQYQGPERARYLVTLLRDEAARHGARPAFTLTTPYRNTIAPEQEDKSPGNRGLEHKIRSAIR